MSSTTRWWLGVPLVAGLALAGCSSDDGGSADSDARAGADPATTANVAPGPTGDEDGDAAAGGAAAGPSVGTLTLGDEVIALASFRCFFEEQPRAGLGGVFTHSAQGQGTNAGGEAVLLDMTRARAEDGTVDDDLSVGIGDPFGDEYVELHAGGPEGLIEFGDASAAASGIEVADFGSDSGFVLTFDLSCG